MLTTTRLAISDEDIAEYHCNGAVLLRGVLDPEELRLLETGVDEAYADPGPRSSIVRDPQGGGETLVETSPSHRSPALRELMRRGPMAEIAGRVMRVPSAQLIFEQIFYKTRGRIVPTPWHQDTPFLRVRGYDMCRVWLTCDYSPADITVQMVRGSHRWNVVYSTGTGEEDAVVKSEENATYSNDNIGDPNLPRTPDVARYRDSFDILSFDVEPGDALVFQGNMIHGAFGRDHWDSPRRAFATMWGGPDVRYHKPSGKAFPPPGNLRDHPIPNGARIGDHTEVFPLGWQVAS
jgi:ectoine hydroxylase-related dioxygenase (phytanoyl-CoA dioxygenase family)